MIFEIASEVIVSIASSPRQIASFANEFNILSAPVLLIVGIALAFFGRRFLKILVFLAGGLVGAAIGFAIGSLLFAGTFTIVGALVGFIILGLIAYSVMHLAFGIILAAVSFFLTRLVVSNNPIAIFTQLRFSPR